MCLDEKSQWIWSHHVRACTSHQILTTPVGSSLWICLNTMGHALVHTGGQQSGGPGTGLLPCPPGWPRLPGLLACCSPVLPALLSWTVSTTKVRGFLLQYFKAYCFWCCLFVWVEVANFIFYCDICLCWVVEVVWQPRVTEAQMGTSATTLALHQCQCWHTGNVCQPGVSYPQRLWCVYHCS